MVVADGRQPGYSAGMTLDALTAVFEQLGAHAAINLDGGGSSTLAARVDGDVRALNRPIHTGIPGRERPVANQLACASRLLTESHRQNLTSGCQTGAAFLDAAWMTRPRTTARIVHSPVAKVRQAFINLGDAPAGTPWRHRTGLPMRLYP